jgi:hypothetical protein
MPAIIFLPITNEGEQIFTRKEMERKSKSKILMLFVMPKPVYA